jgi:hypothetical protein
LPSAKAAATASTGYWSIIAGARQRYFYASEANSARPVQILASDVALIADRDITPSLQRLDQADAAD